ncbi:DegT/DnrJ/EryC1/StrS family aminotransferase, partial [Mycobacterium tuberculosis]|nr:DegT/DnrJ/EryC1/StrS family aminotransferase [Mycobacterium tuberculosis]
CTAVATRTLHSLATNAELVESADLTVTEDICSRIVSLPVHDHMAIADVARVVAPFGEGLARGVNVHPDPVAGPLDLYIG